ncbi:protein FAM83D isoform X2 [Micropterus salmoides]|uniref:protein FAM83D isoform X2 n=1 Tax=Micropterus salmoides TaxID=27706 RepID=UPI0018ED7ED0|nr:protein FAM83D isoform X2 [Micropterus salmoides]
MVNSQEQSLDEETVFVPVNESSPEYLHCEKERQAVERLLNAGTAAFYSSIDTERSSCFLSSEEVSQISSWAQDYCFSPLQVQREADGEEGSSEREDFCSTYFPSQSDTPPPNLELGWPEKCQWAPKGSVTVHTSPPAEGEPPVREIIRRHLQKATKVIAIVTDRLTDGSIIGDLHGAASRGVPVYIILNQRSIQENFTLNRLGHPNMQVRVLGGKTFCSRTGRMVVGEMKDKFLLVDLETVIHGSYSLTWTDAHLHRQLITVLSGPVVDSFDREFRILFAASLPVPDTWRVAGTHVYVTHRLKDISDLRFKKPFPLDSEISNPPSPPPDSLLDWEAMGVVQRECSFLDSPLDQQEEIMAKEMMNNRIHFVDKKREDCITEKAPSRQLSVEKSTHLNDRTTTRLGDEAIGPANNMVMRSSTERKECSILEEKRGINETSKPKVENTPPSRKPIILRIPQSDSYSCLSDIMKRFRPQQSTSGLFRRGSKAAVSEMSRSMMDLSMHNTDTNHGDRGNPVPRFRASCFEPGLMTPALALMKKRNDDMKSVLYRTPKTFLPRERPRSSRYSLSMDWRRSLAEKEGDPE